MKPHDGHDISTLMRVLVDGRGAMQASDAYLVPIEMVLAIFDSISYQAARAAPPPTPKG